MSLFLLEPMISLQVKHLSLQYVIIFPKLKNGSFSFPQFELLFLQRQSQISVVCLNDLQFVGVVVCNTTVSVSNGIEKKTSKL